MRSDIFRAGDERDSCASSSNTNLNHRRRCAKLYIVNQIFIPRFLKHFTQVPLLNRLGDNENALAKAIESRDADLIYLTIFHLQRHLPFQVFS